MPHDRKEYPRHDGVLAWANRPASGRVTRKRDRERARDRSLPPQAVDVCAVGMHVRQAVADPVIGVNEALAVGRLGLAPQVRDVRFRFD